MRGRGRPLVLQRADVHFVLLAPLIVCGHLIAAYQQAQRLGGVRDLHAEVGRLQAIEMHRQLRLADVQRRVEVDDAWLLARLVEHRVGELLQLAEIGPVDRELNLRVLVAAAADRRNGPHACPQVGRRELRQNAVAHLVHHHELIARSLVQRLQTDVDGAEFCVCGRIVGRGHQRVVHLRQPPHGGRDPVRDQLGCVDARAFRRAQAQSRTRTGRRWAGSSCSPP